MQKGKVCYLKLGHVVDGVWAVQLGGDGEARDRHALGAGDLLLLRHDQQRTDQTLFESTCKDQAGMHYMWTEGRGRLSMHIGAHRDHVHVQEAVQEADGDGERAEVELEVEARLRTKRLESEEQVDT